MIILSRIRSELAFVCIDPRLLAFGFLVTMCSTFGQTFFISLYADYIKADFSLTNGEFGAAYSMGTIASAAILTWSGHWIDRLDLRLWTKIVIGVFILACLTMAMAQNFVTLVIAIFLLRQAGQGLMTHTAMTSQARYHDKARGRAVATAGLGFPAAESFVPMLGVLLAIAIGWRETWFLYAGFMIVGLLPLVMWLLKGHDQRHAQYLLRDAKSVAVDEEKGGQKSDTGASYMHKVLSHSRRHWQRREVLRDYRFYVLLPVILAPSFISTGLFFHQNQLASDKGWLLLQWAGTFPALAVASVVGAIVAGFVTDRIGAVRLLPYVLPPLGLACFVLSQSDSIWIAWSFMALLGVTTGTLQTFFGAFWAEAYGTRHLGGIRALATALMVLSSALSPVIMGLLIDAHVSMNVIALACAAYCIFGTAVAVLSSRIYQKTL
ncbi:MAG: MFS transporter [Alphaproteobacteria bacterium]|jgi:MFS family permease|nr:MFS transporter [Alphaproteobacteria bacterium]MBT5920117.1 MFS transporter [Alphaproteobacteria bacterium]MBT6386152.1 MFS transporter [Alphaproteobacteria bacterium]